MVPKSKEVTYALFEDDKDVVLPEDQRENSDLTAIPEEEKSVADVDKIEDKNKTSSTTKDYKIQIVWRNVAAMVILHGLAIYGLSLLALIKTQTFAWVLFLSILGSMGVTAGAHRLWTHKAYRANAGVRLFLSLCFVMALQNDVYEWARDHRAHHKFSETDADPHNSKRGFFFSHVGWLLVKKHPDVVRRGKTIDLSDLEADPIVMFQRRFYIPLVLIFWGLVPTLVPVYYWGESAWYAFLVAVVLRYVYTLNSTWLVNSWAHLYGVRPYDKRIAPVEASMRHMVMGEGFHNYHHAFPWDYSASEHGPADVFNPATALIDFFAFMGWAWDLKKASSSLVEMKMKSTGDEKVADFYPKKSAITEWLGGLATTFVPFSFFRYVFCPLLGWA